MQLRIATAQFPVSRDVARNLSYIERYIARAAQESADLVLFPETALTGYAGIDFDSVSDIDWSVMEEACDRVHLAAASERIWAVVGTHFRSSHRKPFNSLLVIDNRGRTVDRYDKRILTRMDQRFYTPGLRRVIVKVKRVSIGMMICHEWRYPELYRDYKRHQADVILQSWYDGSLTAKEYESEGRVMSEVIPAAAQGHAACSHLWICGANTSQRISCFGGFVVRPDGAFAARQPLHRAGVMVTDIDTKAEIPDWSAHARKAVMEKGLRFEG